MEKCSLWRRKMELVWYAFKGLERVVVCGINFKLDQAQLNCCDLRCLDVEIPCVFSVEA